MHPKVDGLAVARVGTTEQPVLARRGDDVRIDWGYGYLAAPAGVNSIGASGGTVAAGDTGGQLRSGTGAIVAGDTGGRLRGAGGAIVAGGNGGRLRREFTSSGTIPAAGSAAGQAGGPAAGDSIAPAPVSAGRHTMAAAWDLGAVGPQGATRYAMLAYDDIKSIRYFSNDLAAYWRRNGATMETTLRTAARDRDALEVKTRAFDADLQRDLERAGGAKYAAIAMLAYRQTLAATKLVADTNGYALLFPKENFSNGCIATVDVIYPMAPQFLLFGPVLAKALVVSNLDYASGLRWKFPFAPHDLGTYPHAAGQV
ncbi:MAG: DUF4965 domain-containing protein [Acidobacteriota bacterium]